jgi:hypothetical protein
MTRLRQQAAVAALVFLAAAGSAIVAQEPNLTEDQIREFLLKAKITASHQTSKGVTSPWRLTLTDGKLTHDAAFQSIDEQKSLVQLSRGTTEIGFRDSYHFNIAAFELAKLLGLGDMLPVTVERSWGGSKGSLSWWLPVKMDGQDRQKQNLEPPDANAWNMQMNRLWVFSQLVYDTDFNQTNILISADWKIWRIDFSRAFRLQHKLENPACLTMCDRQLLEKLRQLDETVVMERTKPHLTKLQVKAIMARRDLIVAFFEKQIAEKGEKAVLY